MQTGNNFNAHHSPLGAFASFTLGFAGAKGGLGLELGGPANQNIYIGVEQDDRSWHMLPFFEKQAGQDEALRFDMEGGASGEIETSCAVSKMAGLHLLEANDFSREFQLATDTWT